MPLKIVLAQFWRDIRAQRLRTALTLFGIAWGTFCVIVLLSFGEGIHRAQGARSEAMGDRIILIWGGRTSIPHEGLPRGRYVALKEEDAAAIRSEVAGVREVSTEYTEGVSLRYGDRDCSASMAGVYPAFARMRKLEVEPGGRFLNDRDQAERRRVAVLGARIVRDLFGEGEAIGEQVEVDGIPFMVIGTLPEKDQDSNYNGPDDWKIFVPSEVTIASFGHIRPDNLVIEMERGVDGGAVTEAVFRVMARLHHFDPEDREPLLIWDVSEMVAMFTLIFTAFKAFLGVLGVITLAVAGIGVSNTMSMVVEDRTSQIGISMALGARRSWVLSQVMLETFCFVVLGGGIGVALAAGVVTLAQGLPAGFLGHPIFSNTIAILTAGMLGIVGIISGMGPARRAAYLRPAEALRG